MRFLTCEQGLKFAFGYFPVNPNYKNQMEYLSIPRAILMENYQNVNRAKLFCKLYALRNETKFATVHANNTIFFLYYQQKY